MLATGFPVGVGGLFVAVLPPMPTPTPALTATHNGRPRSAGNAEATKAIEKVETMVDCFILETDNEMIRRRLLDASECLRCSDTDDRSEDRQPLYSCLNMYR